MPTKVIIIGAGWFGLATAKTYLQVDPTIELVIFEKGSTVGGPWARDRIYLGLTAQQPFGILEYSDLPLEPDEGMSRDEFVPAEGLSKYTQEYAKKFNLLERIYFNSEVYKITRAENSVGWNVWAKVGNNSDGAPLYCDKLILATGLTAQPNIPTLQSSGFIPPTFHSQELGSEVKRIESPAVSHVTVYGGGKSALDVVSTCIGLGKHVDWVIRRTGSGAPSLKPSHVFGQSSDGFLGSRYGSKWHPTIYSHKDYWYWFLHSGKNRFGFWLQWAYWGLVSRITNSQFGYGKSENFEKLRPDVLDRSMFWENTLACVVTRPEVLPVIHKGEQVKVHREGIRSLAGEEVLLDSGESLYTNAVIFATGWDVSQPQFSDSDAAHLGLPVRKENYPGALKKKWDYLEQEAEARVIEMFPRIASPPPTYKAPKLSHTPFRLYNCILPPELFEKNDRSFVFVGAIGTGYTAIVSEVHALWAVAWMTGNLNLKLSGLEVEKEVALLNMWLKKRYLTAGEKMPYILNDFLPMIDVMLKELGVNSNRKSGVLGELFSIYRPTDYRGIVDEWKEIHGI